MTIEELEQLKADGMIDDRKYQQLKSAISMQGYQPGQQVATSNAYEMTNYGKNLQAQAEPMEQNFNPSFGYDAQAEKIAKLEQQIAQVKERIARNERTLKNKSFEDVNNKLADLEMSKIGFRLNKPSVNQDPTSFWRWNMQRLDTQKANDQVKSNTANKFVNEAEALTKTSISPDYTEQVQQLRNVRNKIAEGKTLGYDVSGLEEMEKEIQAKVDKTYGNIEAVKTIKNKLKNLDQQLADKTITAEQYTAGVNMLKGADFDDDELRNELDTKSMLGNKKGDDAAKAAIEKKAKELAEKDGEDWNDLSATAKANYRKKAGGK